MSAIYALILRDLKRLTHTKTQIAAALAQPILYFLVMGAGLNPIYEKAVGASYLHFIAPGIVATTAASAAMFAGMGMFWDREFGLMRAMLVAPVSRVQIAIGRVGGTVVLAAVQGLLMAVICFAMGFRPARLALLPFGVLFLLLTPLVFGALSTAIGASARKMETLQVIMNTAMLPMFLISGAIFPLASIPRVLSALVSINPLSYGVDGLRGALIGESHFGIVTDLGVLCLLSALMIALSAWRVSKIEG